jgi:hypothetical protein
LYVQLLLQEAFSPVVSPRQLTPDCFAHALHVCCCRPLLCCLAFKQHTPETVKQLLAVVKEQQLL